MASAGEGGWDKTGPPGKNASVHLISYMARASQALPASLWKVRAGRVLAFLLARTGVDAVGPVRLRDGTVMLLDGRGRTEGEAVWNGRFDPDLLHILATCTPAGGRLLDVGANVGLISVPMARRLQATGGKVLAVEPVAVNEERLRTSAALNDVDIQIFRVALGDHAGSVVMHRDTGLGATSGNAIMGDPGEGYGTESNVELTTLDTLDDIASISPIDVIKIDIEGAELSFLQGARRFLERNRPIVFGEFNSGLMPRFGHSFVDVAELLAPLAYRYIKFRAGREPMEVKPAVGMGNALLVPDERFNDVFESLRAGFEGSRRPDDW